MDFVPIPGGPRTAGPPTHPVCLARALLGVLLVAGTACGSGKAPPNGGGRDGGTADGGSIDGGSIDGGGDPGAPIVDRTARLTKTCTLERGPTNYAPRSWSYVGHSLTSNAAGTAYLMRLESPTNDPINPVPPSLSISTVALDGTLGAAIHPSTGDPGSIGPSSMARQGSGVAAAWVEGSALRFMTMNADGSVAIAAKAIPGTNVDTNSQIALTEGTAGFGLVWQAAGQGAVELLTLDANGAPRASPVELVRAAGFGPSGFEIAPSGDGYAVAWLALGSDRSHVWFKTVDGSGQERTPAIRLSETDQAGVFSGGGSGFSRSGISIAPIAEGFAVAWPEASAGSFETSRGGRSVVRVVKVSSAGARLGTPSLLRGPTEDIDEVEPVLFTDQGALGIVWSRGSHIYACGGCTPNHRTDLVLLDPTDLVPISNVLSVPPAPTGLMSKSVATTGGGLLLTFHITYHVTFDPGSLAVRCQ